MRTFSFLCVCICFSGSLAKAVEHPILRNERPTLLNTRDPRPDILPRPFYDNHTEYRSQYNRPRFFTGWLAYEMSRTSQEAMVWKENYCSGNYDQHHMPAVYKTYYYPKPWEALNVGARPDYASVKPKTQRVPGATQSEAEALTLIEESNRKPKTRDTENASDDTSAKDNTDARADDKASESETPDANQVEVKKPEVVPSPSDKSSSRPTSKKSRPVTLKPSLQKVS
jgi:hypothetical protein